MKTAVSIPDDVFERAETIAAERNLTRSALYAEALRALIKQIDDARISAEINAGLAETGQVPLEPGRLNYLRAELKRDGSW